MKAPARAFAVRFRSLSLVAALLPLAGCLGGSSSEGGNPDITLEFRRDGEPYEFAGLLQIVAAGSDPEFYYAYPDDGTTPPALVFGIRPDAGPGPLVLPRTTSLELKWNDLAAFMNPRERLRLFKRSAARRAAGPDDSVLPDFNIILQSSDGASLAAWVPSLHQEERGYRSAAGDSGTAFIVDLKPESRIAGRVDTTGPAGRPMALYVPGTPYYALVHADRFAFVGLPLGRLPLRWLAPDGRIYAVSESLAVAGEDSLADPLSAGERMDSVSLPEPFPTLEPPVADPPGQYAFTDSVAVALTAEDDADIYYTLDGSAPGREAKRYEKPLVLRSSATLKAVAYAPGHNPSPVAVNNYVLAPAPPSIAPGAGTFLDSVVITITGPGNGSVYYTTDGSTPSAQAVRYTGPFVLRASSVVQAIVLVPGLGSSAAASVQYRIQSDSLPGSLP